MSGFRASTAVVGVGATDYFKRGTSPLSSTQLVLQAILRACEDAGADPRTIDGFVSYAGDSSEGLVVGAALGVHEVRWSTQVWGGGGGAVAAAAARWWRRRRGRGDGVRPGRWRPRGPGVAPGT